MNGNWRLRDATVMANKSPVTCLALGGPTRHDAKPLFKLEDLHLQRHDHDHDQRDQEINDAVRTHLLPPLKWLTASSIAVTLKYNRLIISASCGKAGGLRSPCRKRPTK